MRDRFHWARLLSFVTGLVNQELLLRNEYLAAENRILRAHLPARLRLSDAERSRVVKESSDTGVELQQAAESVATANGPALGTQRYVGRREEEKVAPTLVVPFKMMMFDVFVQRPA
jgi:hypothetical protein